MPAIERERDTSDERAVTIKGRPEMLLYGLLAFLALGQGATWLETGGTGKDVAALKEAQDADSEALAQTQTNQAVQGETLKNMSQDLKRLADGQAASLKDQAGDRAGIAELRALFDALDERDRTQQAELRARLESLERERAAAK